MYPTSLTVRFFCYFIKMQLSTKTYFHTSQSSKKCQVIRKLYTIPAAFAITVDATKFRVTLRVVGVPLVLRNIGSAVLARSAVAREI